MHHQHFLTLDEIERRVCEIAVDSFGVDREEARPESRLIEDFLGDSLDFLDFIIRLELQFDISVPDDLPESAKTIFTRREVRLADVAELVYIRQGTGHEAGRRSRRRQSSDIGSQAAAPRNTFLQLSGVWRNLSHDENWLLEPFGTESNTLPRFRRRSDGMPCVKIPADDVEIGGSRANSPADEQPGHIVEMDEFLIDAEPVSTTAYCRFLNSIGETSPETLADWFVLDPIDDRETHMPIRHSPNGWEPVEGAAYWPMMLVSWFGANAYSLWANAWDWRLYREQHDSEAPCFLPSEAQWEYAARGPRAQAYPWGDESPRPDLARCERHKPLTTYDINDLPLADVHEPLGVSPFGLYHMAGNAWNWCRDWYDPHFYSRPESKTRNPVNHAPTGIRSERGGSWVGPAELCRSSYRRGRQPLARGRCLGFRCVSSLKDAPNGHQ